MQVDGAGVDGVGLLGLQVEDHSLEADYGGLRSLRRLGQKVTGFTALKWWSGDARVRWFRSRVGTRWRGSEVGRGGVGLGYG